MRLEESIRMDKIYIDDLLLRCVIGAFDWERKIKQDIIVNLVLSTDIRQAARTDSLGDTVNYKEIRDKIVAFTEASDFHLLESLAEAIAGLCLETAGVQAVKVRVDKPGALRFSRRVAVEIERDNCNT